ncbi:hypothetical protein BDR07DRAFT_1381290 [Suillus spraguei]|nr:hypothetical protein BDR07DRAFT_1381290 [Suillus spraguei]
MPETSHSHTDNPAIQYAWALTSNQERWRARVDTVEREPLTIPEKRAREYDVEIIETAARRALIGKDRAMDEEDQAEIVELPATKRAFTGKERAADDREQEERRLRNRRERLLKAGLV